MGPVCQHQPGQATDGSFGERTALDEEKLIAERDVLMNENQKLSVRISVHEAEDFWRVDVRHPAAARGVASATVSSGESYLMPLIHGAVSGDQAAWHHLARWGHANLIRPATGFRAGWE
jgi:hypothetical protein